ncbi:MAG TPA: hypothetical protein VHC43_10515 [Mycobacteriales bacterium]|nr:hypothetical protein [Mycobacteriales bacterium]
MATHSASATTPVLDRELPAGHIDVHDLASSPRDGRLARSANGSLKQWIGHPSGYAGSHVYSRGEYVYTDYLYDAYGAAGPSDAARDAALDDLASQNPDLYRAQDLPLMFVSQAYGAGPEDYAADIDQVRVAAPGNRVDLLVRTSVMTRKKQPAILVLVGSSKRSDALTVPFNSGLRTRRASYALLLTARRGEVVDLANGTKHSFRTAANPKGYVNAIEASIPRSLIGSPSNHLSIAVAAGRLDNTTGLMAARKTGPAVANVAFREDELARPFFDKLQAAALEQDTIDPFFTNVRLARLRRGVNQTATPGPGYFERVMSTSRSISKETEDNGILQPYGLYVPSDVNIRRPVASTLYLHGSNDGANLEPVIIPGLMRALGDQRHTVVIAPKGRTGFGMWEGAGLRDAIEAQHGASRAVAMNPRRRTLVGYSMGGYGAFLLACLFPDRFAATWSIEGLIGGFDPAPATQLIVPDVRQVFANLRSVPTLIRQGGSDFNVDAVNGLDAEKALHALRYRSRLLIFPADTHYTPGIVDSWAPEVRYLQAHSTIDEQPRRIAFVRSMPFERAVDRAAGSDQTIFPRHKHQMHFNHDFWVQDLVPANPTSGTATVDATTFAVAARRHQLVATSGHGISGDDPYTWTGDGWDTSAPPTRTSNRFRVALSGAKALTLNLRGMRIRRTRPVVGVIRTTHPLRLVLRGRWKSKVAVTYRRHRLRTRRDDGALVIHVPASHGVLRIAHTDMGGRE